MKKYICLVMVICLTATFAQAQDVTFSAADNGGLEISYTSTTPPRGIALKCTVLGGDLVSIDTGAVTQDAAFNTNIDFAYTVYTGGGTYNIGDGHPIADPCGPGELALTTDIAQFSICLGVLDQSGNQAPGPAATTLVTIPLTSSTSTTTVSILVEEDSLRGGVAGSVLSTNLPLPPVDISVGGGPECFKNTDPGSNDWVAAGSPDCWCFRRQCRGDIDGVNSGPFAVGLVDLGDLLAALNQFALPATLPNSGNVGLCANLNHVNEGPFKVGLADLGELLKYLNQFVVAECPMTHINAWTN
jgi:hypothetical protein